MEINRKELSNTFTDYLINMYLYTLDIFSAILDDCRENREWN